MVLLNLRSIGTIGKFGTAEDIPVVLLDKVVGELFDVTIAESVATLVKVSFVGGFSKITCTCGSKGGVLTGFATSEFPRITVGEGGTPR